MSVVLCCGSVEHLPRIQGALGSSISSTGYPQSQNSSNKQSSQVDFLKDRVGKGVKSQPAAVVTNLSEVVLR